MQIRRTPTRLHAVIAVCAVLLSASASHGQSAAPTSPAAPERISIDIHVTDKAGHHISGLKAEDFTLLDNKQPRQFFDFREIDTRNTAADPLQVIIVIDAINTGFEVVAREREQLTEFLKQDGGRLGHPTSLAILTDKGIKMQPRPSLDGNALIANLNESQADLRTIGRSAGYWGATERVQTSLQQLGQLVQIEGPKPGRKLLFFLSPGWPLLAGAGVQETEKQRQWTFGYIVGLSNGLRAARITLYSVDPFGLGRTDPFYYQNFTKGISNPNNAEYPALGLQVFVTHTGGIVETNGTDVLGGLNNAIRDADACYTLTFEAPAADRLNEYHDLRLQVDKPGVTPRTTSGYYANVAH